MDPRHRKILKAVVDLRDDGRTAVTRADVAVKLGLRDPTALGVFFDEVCALGWIRAVTRGFTGDTDFTLTPDGEHEFNAAVQRPEPTATIEELAPKLREFLNYWAFHQPFQPRTLGEWLRLDELSPEDLRLLIAQMHVRGMVRPHGDGWYPV